MICVLIYSSIHSTPSPPPPLLALWDLRTAISSYHNRSPWSCLLPASPPHPSAPTSPPPILQAKQGVGGQGDRGPLDSNRWSVDWVTPHHIAGHPSPPPPSSGVAEIAVRAEWDGPVRGIAGRAGRQSVMWLKIQKRGANQLYIFLTGWFARLDLLS